MPPGPPPSQSRFLGASAAGRRLNAKLSHSVCREGAEAQCFMKDGARPCGAAWQARFDGHISSISQSARKAINGSMHDARHAGTQHGKTDTPASIRMTPAEAIGSRGDGQNRSVVIVRLARRAPERPAAIPSPVSRIASPKTSATILLPEALHAAPTPLSWVRSVTFPECMQ